MEEKFARRTRRWNEHLQIVVSSRRKDPEAKECMACLFPPGKGALVMVERLILQLGWWDHWAGETKIRLFISTHLRRWASFHDDHILVTDSTRNPWLPAHRCGFSVCHHTHVGERVRECGSFSVYPWPQLKNDSGMVFWWWVISIISTYEPSFLMTSIDFQVLGLYKTFCLVYIFPALL